MPGQLTLGPILYHWEAAKKLDFYRRIADEAPVDTVYLGEVICSKRSPFFEQHLPDVIARLERGGKKVVLSSLTEVVLKRERAMTRSLCEIDDHEIEINNMAGLMNIDDRPYRAGPHMNVYNEKTLTWLAKRGATHFTLPNEVPATVVEKMAAAADAAGSALEIQVFGRASLAVSARCYHARAHQRSKDNCQFVCENDPDGMLLTTVTGQPFLAVNGIQTQSYSYISLAAEVPSMLEMGISAFRLSPQSTDMVAVAGSFSELLSGKTDGGEAQARLEELNTQVPFSNGFWHGKVGWQRFGPRAA